jgi:hypothetical protein
VIEEVSIGGVFVPVLLIWAVLALAPLLVLRRLLAGFGLYRFVWHRALFDIALYVVILGALAASSSTIERLVLP